MNRRDSLVRTQANSGASLGALALGGIPSLRAAPPQEIRWSRRRHRLVSPSEDNVVLVAVGDTILVNSMFYEAPNNTRNLFGILSDADLTFATLSTTLADYGAPESKDVFIAPTHVVEDLVAAGVDVVTIATNHLLDAGTRGLSQTLAALKGVNVNAVGGGENLEDAKRPVTRRIKGQRIAFLGFHTALNWEKPRGSAAATPTSPGVNPVHAQSVRVGFDPSESLVLPLDSDLRDAEMTIRQAKRGADFVVTSLNIDWEHPDSPNSEGQIPEGLQMLARTAIDAGADLVLGSGAHRIYPVERYNEKYIIYGTGNFFFHLFEDNKPASRYGLFPETESRIRSYIGRSEYFESVLVRAVLSRKEMSRIDLIPFALSADGNPHLTSDEQASRILAKIKTDSQPLGATIHTDEWHGWIEQGEET